MSSIDQKRLKIKYSIPGIKSKIKVKICKIKPEMSEGQIRAPKIIDDSPLLSVSSGEYFQNY